MKTTSALFLRFLPFPFGLFLMAGAGASEPVWTFSVPETTVTASPKEADQFRCKDASEGLCIDLQVALLPDGRWLISTQPLSTGISMGIERCTFDLGVRLQGRVKDAFALNLSFDLPALEGVLFDRNPVATLTPGLSAFGYSLELTSHFEVFSPNPSETPGILIEKTSLGKRFACSAWVANRLEDTSALNETLLSRLGARKFQ